jgi:hypothetical protein
MPDQIAGDPADHRANRPADRGADDASGHPCHRRRHAQHAAGAVLQHIEEVFGLGLAHARHDRGEFGIDLVIVEFGERRQHGPRHFVKVIALIGEFGPLGTGGRSAIGTGGIFAEKFGKAFGAVGCCGKPRHPARNGWSRHCLAPQAGFESLESGVPVRRYAAVTGLCQAYHRGRIKA